MTDLAACDFVYEACDELRIQKQALHCIDGLSGNSPVIYCQLIKAWTKKCKNKTDWIRRKSHLLQFNPTQCQF